MANPSTIWAQLAMPNPPAGSIPFVLSDGATIGTDVLNFNYDSINKLLSVSNGLEVNSLFTQVGVASPVTINYPAGEFTIKAGTLTTTVMNNRVTSGTIVLLQRRNSDATLGSLIVDTSTPGQFRAFSATNATADCNINFILFNTNPQLA